MAGENLRWLEKVFQRTVGDHGEISLNDFKTIVQSKNVSTTAPFKVSATVKFKFEYTLSLNCFIKVQLELKCLSAVIILNEVVKISTRD